MRLRVLVVVAIIVALCFTFTDPAEGWEDTNLQQVDNVVMSNKATFYAERNAMGFKDLNKLGSKAPGTSFLQGKDNNEKIFLFLCNEVGLNTAAACSLLGVMSVENAANNPDLLQYGKTWADMDAGNDAGYGILQWTNTKRYHAWRFKGLAEFCTNEGYDYKTLDGQLYYLKWELEEMQYFKNLKVLETLKALPNTKEGAAKGVPFFMRTYMGCANNAVAKRTTAATDVFWPKYS